MGRVRWRIQRTALLVVEGYADKEFVLHLKALYHRRGSGFRLVLKNAKGKELNDLFSKSILEHKRQTIEVLDRLLKFIETGESAGRT